MLPLQLYIPGIAHETPYVSHRKVLFVEVCKSLDIAFKRESDGLLVLVVADGDRDRVVSDFLKGWPWASLTRSSRSLWMT